MGRLRHSVPYVAGLGLGLFLARTIAEATRVAWSLPALLGLTAVAVTAGLALALYALSAPTFHASRPTLCAIAMGLGITHHASLVFFRRCLPCLLATR